MNTLDIEIALMEKYDVSKKIIVHNVHWGVANLHECDILILSSSNYATEIEIKISKQDLKNDILKSHGHIHNHIKEFYFCVPEKLKDFALDQIPLRAGLMIAVKGSNGRIKIEEVRKATKNRYAVKWSEAERTKLLWLGCMRILNLKKAVKRAKQNKIKA